MGRIAILPPALANQIAAGEVIERPASVVKELVENSVDAGATRVAVSVRGGGCQSIIVRDDGEGMSREDALLAFARHATSKIECLDDLIGIQSFGFRGEALASIAAAADVELLTRRADDDTATRVCTRAGVVVDVADAGSARGTQVEVRDLFGALPARRKFLRRPATEFGHAAEVINRMALAAPAVGFTLTHDEREVLDFPPVTSPADRLLQVIGRECAGSMIHFEARTSAISVQGYLGRPDHSLSSARLLLTYVGGRFVRDRVLTRAMLAGYDTVLMRGRYPVAVVFLEVAAGEVDVNVHPAKAEVRFRDPGLVHRFVAGRIAERLRGVLNRAVRPAPAQSVQPAGPVGGRPGEAPPTMEAWKRPRSEVIRSDSEGTGWKAERQGISTADSRKASVGEAESSYGSEPGHSAVWVEGPGPAVSATGSAGRSLLQTPGGFFGSLRVLGQILDGYVVCASDRGLVLVDQHAAHERVRFEQLRKQLASGGVPMQRLLVPEPLTLGVRDVRALEDAGEALARLGFEGEPFGDGVYLLRAVPAVLADTNCAAVLRDVAAERAELGASRGVEEAVETVLASIACHSAIRLGRRLEEAEAEALLRAMDEVDFSGYCPHGRPAFVEIDAAALERMFKR
jgi:DNA mismatch repair protein MutL